MVLPERSKQTTAAAAATGGGGPRRLRCGRQYATVCSSQRFQNLCRLFSTIAPAGYSALKSVRGSGETKGTKTDYPVRGSSRQALTR